MHVLRRYIRLTLMEAREFDEWLSPDVMTVLIQVYAEKSSTLGHLRWEYGQLPNNVWGVFNSRTGKLTVNKSKTKSRFKQQVETILHEMQHWNQFVEVAAGSNADGSGAVRAWRHAYDGATRAASGGPGRNSGYWNNKYEADARAFATKHLQSAMGKIGDHYGGRVSGGMDDAIEEMVDEYTDLEEPISRKFIGETLSDYKLHGPDNMQAALAQLRELGVEFR